MLVAAAVCPHPPLLVPQVAGAAAPELDDLRAACAAAVGSLLDARPDVLAVAGGADVAASFPGDAAGTLRPWGPDVRVGPGDPVLPLSLTIGRWLVERAHASGCDLPALRFEAAGFDEPPAECAALGRRLAESARRVALLVMGDGSARRTEKAPGYIHPDAVPYDEMLAAALASGDTGRLLGLDPDEARELWAAGRAAFQVLGGAAREAPSPAASELLYDDAPYGVGYFVARWAW
ncbi:class III extradiol dioxygenase subunit B-like domain-containing protein [Microbispora sp. NEAU-D428]|uniref:class III extradiol dioxygenase subunit B-like domain-containing protein n=1 Tax=Microbispora sitophila TaxID=2771537 RepID=UPI0018683C05|nr:class III extradiol dioxygenase subunit B-like domain-containing protein [Microbispora sitophila]MBE3010103.1 class III extradiol dioxygenase subunit B-like domain-containing protein [Microbispora sitophila]